MPSPVCSNSRETFIDFIIYTRIVFFIIPTEANSLILPLIYPPLDRCAVSIFVYLVVGVEGLRNLAKFPQLTDYPQRNNFIKQTVQTPSNKYTR